MTQSRDTICALASGPPPAAIATLRLSGPDVQSIIGKRLSKPALTPRRAMLVELFSESGETIDKGLAVFMPGPGSYTGEDTLEITLHGGRMIIELALKSLMSAGARLADPGEYTRRAFEAGKLDLTRAEAVADLIDAESEAQLGQALRQMGGALEILYSDWRVQMTECLALLEASIDFPDEEDAPDRVDGPVAEKIKKLIEALDLALTEGNITERIRDGFRVAILGKPNAGKSTLLNQLAKREAAIVTDIPGTTRDVVEVRLTLGGYLVWISDTAGLRETDDIVEAEGVRRARQAGAEADLRIWMFDAREPIEDDLVQPGDIVVVNKSDLVSPDVSRETLLISAKEGKGVERVEASIVDRLSGLTANLSAPMITRARHRQGIERAKTHLNIALDHLNMGMGAEFTAEEVRLASRELGALTGHVETEMVLGAVFSSFCIGK
ncbi:MAG: tRNA uridine-5-carboxymethylaminomethyl(34) synthesis GTPase MnmE [Henriciella sp.]|nr:tRNA uridine-5-carboxymethylaminomethyl(34) synthesis GTPase MnmE [Henriciella sp.]